MILRRTPRQGDHEDQYMLQDIDPVYNREGRRQHYENASSADVTTKRRR